MSVAWLAMVNLRSTQPCACEACAKAGCERPPVRLQATSKHPERWLHGSELLAFYADEDAATVRKNALFESLKQDLAARGIHAQRGNEPFTRRRP